MQPQPPQDDPTPTPAGPAGEPEIVAAGRGPRVGDGAQGPADAVDVGEFRQGSPLSQWALARYLIGRAVAESMGLALLLLAGIMVVLAVIAAAVLHSALLAGVFAILAVGDLMLRWLLLALLRRVTGLTEFAPVADRMRVLVRDTRGDVLRELRRIGLPGRTITLPLLALRLVSAARRDQTVARLREFDVDRVVPRARLDELHLLLRNAAGG